MSNAKDWERPWTTEEIVDHADTWNLACDTALLHTLKAFGDKLLSKAEDVNDKIENLCQNLSKIHLQLDLAKNDFSSLRNTQFIECRVYEDDETLVVENTKDEEKNKVPEEETIEDFKEAVALGLEILSEHYERVKVTVSDSEDEDEPSYIYRRIDPYINRRLPLIIGSEEWHKKSHVGLEDTDSEDEPSDKFSDSENEDNYSQNNDCSDVTSELSNLSGFNGPRIPTVPVSLAGSNNRDQSTSESGLDTTDITPKASFAEQLAAKLGDVIKEKENVLKEPEINRRPIQKKSSDYGALFTDEPPPLDDVKVHESQDIFTGGKGLFDDEDENDLWPTDTKDNSTHHPNQASKKPNQADVIKGLFDDSDDDDIFSTNKNQNTQQDKKPYLQSKNPVIPVFDEEPPLFEEKPSIDEKKKPSGGVSLFGKTDLSKDPAMEKILKRRKVSSSDDEDKPEDIKPSNNIPIEKNPPKTQNEKIFPVPKTEEPKEKGLFDDDIFGDDLFSNFENKIRSSSFEKSTLFSDDEENSGLFSSSQNTSKKVQSEIKPSDTKYSFQKNSKSNISSLFNNSEDNTDSSNLSAKIHPVKETKTNEIKSSGLFDDLDDGDDLFWDTSKKDDSSKIKKSISFLFDDDDDDFDIFKPKNDSKSTTKEMKNTKIEIASKEGDNLKSTKPKLNLFDDDLGSPTKENLFENVENSKIKVINKEDLNINKQKLKTSLFDDLESPTKEIKTNTTIQISKKEIEDIKSKKSDLSSFDDDLGSSTKENLFEYDENTKNKVINKEDLNINKPKLKTSLFDDLESPTKEIKTNTKIQISKKEIGDIKSTKSDLSLFDDDLESSKNNLSETEENTKIKVIHREDQNINKSMLKSSLFDDLEGPTKEIRENTEVQISKKEIEDNKSTKSNSSLFDDDSQSPKGNFFETEGTTKIKVIDKDDQNINKPKLKTSLFDDLESPTKEIRTNTEIQISKKKSEDVKSTKSVLSLFDDDLESPKKNLSEIEENTKIKVVHREDQNINKSMLKSSLFDDLESLTKEIRTNTEIQISKKEIGDIESTKSNLSLFDDVLESPKKEFFETEENTNIKVIHREDQNINKSKLNTSLFDDLESPTKEITTNTKIKISKKENEDIKSTKSDLSLFDDDLETPKENLFETEENRKIKVINREDPNINKSKFKASPFDDLESPIEENKNTKSNLSLFDDDLENTTTNLINNEIKDIKISKSNSNLFDTEIENTKEENILKTGQKTNNTFHDDSESLTKHNAVETNENTEKRITGKEDGNKQNHNDLESPTKKQMDKAEVKMVKEGEQNIENLIPDTSRSTQDTERPQSTKDIDKTEVLSEKKSISVNDKPELFKKPSNLPRIHIVEDSISAPSDLKLKQPEVDKYKSSPSALNVKFMDTMPPPDDDWDTYSDNAFDDVEQINDGFQSQPSSLFDNEPPSLYLDDDRSASDDLFDDRSSRKVSSHTNDHIEKDQSLFSSKPPKETENIADSLSNLENDETAEKKLKVKPPIAKKKISANIRSEKSLSFDKPISNCIDERSESMDSVPDEDHTDFLISDINPGNDYGLESEISENIINNDKIREKIISFDNPNENLNDTQRLAAEIHSEDDMQNNISKLKEQLQQNSNRTEERTKPIVVPRKLSHNLNINVGALLPGSALPTPKKEKVPDEDEKLSKSLPASKFNLDKEISPKSNVPTRPITIARVSSEDIPSRRDYHSLEKSVSFDGGTDVEVLRSVTKDRVRIPVKRKPSSRRARQKSLRDSMSAFKIDEPITDESEKLDKTDDETSVNSSKQTDTTAKSSGEILNEVIDDSDLFKTVDKDIKNVNKANIISTKERKIEKETAKSANLFDDELFESIVIEIDKEDTVLDQKSLLPPRESFFSDGESKMELGKEKEVSKNSESSKPNTTEKISKIDDLFDSSDEDDLFKSTKEKDTRKKDEPTISIIGKIAEKDVDASSKIQPDKSKTTDSLFNFSDDEDFLGNFPSRKDNDIKEDKKSTVKNQNQLFDDLDDDDLFGTSSTAGNKTKHDVKPSVINKKPPKSSSLRKLGNVEGEEDPLSALLK